MRRLFKTTKGEINEIENKKTIFKSTLFGDDNDRALQKTMDLGRISHDVAYHLDKVTRNFDNLVNIQGRPYRLHKRITAAVSALSDNKTN